MELGRMRWNKIEWGRVHRKKRRTVQSHRIHTIAIFLNQKHHVRTCMTSSIWDPSEYSSAETFKPDTMQIIHLFCYRVLISMFRWGLFSLGYTVDDITFFHRHFTLYSTHKILDRWIKLLNIFSYLWTLLISHLYFSFFISHLGRGDCERPRNSDIPERALSLLHSRNWNKKCAFKSTSKTIRVRD